MARFSYRGSNNQEEPEQYRCRGAGDNCAQAVAEKTQPHPGPQAKAMSKTEKAKVIVAAELYEQALDESCTCKLGHTPLEDHCLHCAKIEKARRILEKLVGEYQQL